MSAAQMKQFRQALQHVATWLTQLDEAFSLSLQFGIAKTEVDQ